MAEPRTQWREECAKKSQSWNWQCVPTSCHNSKTSGAPRGERYEESTPLNKITTILKQHRVQPTHLIISVSVGATVAASVHFYPLATEVVEVYSVARLLLLSERHDDHTLPVEHKYQQVESVGIREDSWRQRIVLFRRQDAQAAERIDKGNAHLGTITFADKSFGAYRVGSQGMRPAHHIVAF